MKEAKVKKSVKEVAAAVGKTVIADKGVKVEALIWIKKKIVSHLICQGLTSGCRSEWSCIRLNYHTLCGVVRGLDCDIVWRGSSRNYVAILSCQTRIVHNIYMSRNSCTHIFANGNALNSRSQTEDFFWGFLFPSQIAGKLFVNSRFRPE